MNNFAVKSTKCGKSLWSVYEGLAFQSTPPLGRRRMSGRQMWRHLNFNPRLREGGDQYSLTFSRVGGAFQSTPPLGRRRTSFRAFNFPRLFQSTPPRGRRLQPAGQRNISDIISIHASAREATRMNHVICDCNIISIHASAREATALITNFYI